MKRALILFGISVILLAGSGIGGYLYYRQTIRPSSTELPMSPQAQTERITSHLLIRKIEELKDRAVYLQHREEGKKLIILGLGEDPFAEEEPEEMPDTGSGSVVE